jgi:hypothetical protein
MPTPGQYVLHADRGGNSGKTPKLGVVVHDSEGGENSLALIKFCAAPGDRDNGRGGRFGGGYNAIATETGEFYVVADGHRSPYHAPPCNTNMWSICIPGRAAQSRDEWLDAASRGYIRAVAAYIVDRWHADGHRWPLQFCRAVDLRASGNAAGAVLAAGYTTHAEVSKAWRQTDHTDPGSGFPLDVLAAEISALVITAPVPTAAPTAPAATVETAAATPPAPVVLAPATPTAPRHQEDRMATAHITVEGRYAQFYGTGTLGPDGNVHCLMVTWSGPPDPGAPDNAFMRAHGAAPDVVDQHYSLETMRGLVLVGCAPEQITDDRAPGGHWSAADFKPVS